MTRRLMDTETDSERRAGRDDAIKTVLVTGGAGYVGAVLVPQLLANGFRVKVLDLYLFGDDVLASVGENSSLEEIKGDIRDRELVRALVPGCDAIIHLACISNDPSFELNPELSKSINYDAFLALVAIAKGSGVRRFVFASSSSVYGVKQEEIVDEDLPLEPLTDYSRYKAECEDILLAAREPGFVPLVLRPATVCGYSPRLRLDLTVNILTNHAINDGIITVHGGRQTRPNIHIDDVTDLYVQSLTWPADAIDGKVFNAGHENHAVGELAEIVRRVVGTEVEIVTTATNDMRSYRISSERIRRELGFVPRRGIEDAVGDLVAAFAEGRIPDAMTDSRYYNIKTLQAANLS